MATKIKKVNFLLTTPYLDLDTRDFASDVTDAFDPSKAASFVDGEWLMMADGYKVKRATTGETGTIATSPGIVFPMYAERGRTELQALKKCPVIWRGSFEVRTNVLLAANIPTVLGAPLTLAAGDVFGDGQDRTSFKTATADQYVYGYVTRVETAAFDCRIYCSIGGFGMSANA